jgi:subtilisin-like proprotein convertase family protein
MKTFRITLLLGILLANASQSVAAIYTFDFDGGFANNGAIPDGNTTGWFDTRTVTGITDGSITDVNVFLNVNGGYNGDLYAYLSHSSGFAVLLNRVGRASDNPSGYADAGFAVTFDDSATGEIHSYQTAPAYAGSIADGSHWAPDGRNVNPTLALDTDNRTRTLNQFNGLDPNGGWTLFIADLSSGDQGVVTAWGMTITAVPEPSSTCLGILGFVVLLGVKRVFRTPLT